MYVIDTNMEKEREREREREREADNEDVMDKGDGGTFAIKLRNFFFRSYESGSIDL